MALKSRRGARLVVTLCSLIAGCATAEVTEERTYNYYEIDPTSADEIRLAIKAASPIFKAGGQFHGHTSWTVIPQYRWKEKSYGCRLDQVRVRLITTHLMPKLSKAASNSENVRARFDPYYAGLMEHEQGHYQHGVDAAKEIELLLKNFPPYPTCHALTRTAESRIRDVIARYERIGADYDRETDYGRTQGAAIR